MKKEEIVVSIVAPTATVGGEIANAQAIGVERSAANSDRMEEDSHSKIDVRIMGEGSTLPAGSEIKEVIAIGKQEKHRHKHKHKHKHYHGYPNSSPETNETAPVPEQNQPPTKRLKLEDSGENSNTIKIPVPYLGLIERPDLLQHLYSALIKNPHLIVYGDTGTGKTSLLTTYAHTQKSYYKKILWIEAGIDITNSYRETLCALTEHKNQGRELPEEVLAKKLASVIGKDLPCLVIFNNVTTKTRSSIKTFVENLPYKQNDIHIVLTQNEEKGLITFSSLLMPSGYTDDEAHLFLTNTGINLTGHDRDTLIHLTQGHPLFLHAAAYCIQELGWPFEKFLQDAFKASPNTLALNSILDELWQSLSQAQQEALGFCAFIGSENISSQCFENFFQKNSFDGTLNTLEIFLRKTNQQQYSLHPLWATLIREKVKDAHYGKLMIQNYADKLVATLKKHRDEFSICSKSLTNTVYKLSYKHALNFYQHQTALLCAADLLTESNAFFSLIKEIIWYQLHISREMKAASALLNQYAIYFNKSDWLFYQIQLAISDERQQHYREAQEKFNRVLNVLKEQDQQDSDEYTVTLWHFYHTQFKQGTIIDHNLLLAPLGKMQIFLTAMPENKRRAYYLLKYYWLLGNILHKKGRNFYKEAEKYYTSAIKLAQDYQLPIIVSQLKLAGLYRDSRCYVEALQQLDSAAKKITEYYGEEHPEMADCFNEQGNVYLSQGNFEQALGCYHASEKLYASYSMSEHHAKALTNLGYVHYAKGELAAAKKYLLDSINNYKKLDDYAEQHYRLIYTYLDYSKVLAREGNLKEAEEYLENALRLGHVRYGKQILQDKMAHFFVPAIPWQKIEALRGTPESYEKIKDKTHELYGNPHPETFEQHYYWLASRLKHPLPIYRSHSKEELIELIHELAQLLQNIISFNGQNKTECQKSVAAIMSNNMQLVNECIVEAFKLLNTRFAPVDNPSKVKEKTKIQSTLEKSWSTSVPLAEFADIIFSFIDLSGKDFERYLFRDCKFENVYFKEACLKSTRFPNCKFIDCNFENTEMEDTDFFDVQQFTECKTDGVHEQSIRLPREIMNISSLNGYQRNDSAPAIEMLHVSQSIS